MVLSIIRGFTIKYDFAIFILRFFEHNARFHVLTIVGLTVARLLYPDSSRLHGISKSLFIFLFGLLIEVLVRVVLDIGRADVAKKSWPILLDSQQL